MIKLIIGAVIVTVITIGAFLFLDPSVGIAKIGTQDVTEVDSHSFSISVEGEVYKPGTYSLEEGATMADLIEAAGGVTSAADDRAYYESAVLQSNMTYYIASKYDPLDVCGSSELDKVNINIDNATTLATVNGISTSLANAIVTYRSENGLFSTLEAVMQVSGIGSATYKKIRNYIYLHA